MTREQLEHIVRAAAANADTDEIVIVGSQALLGSVPQPTHEVLVRSMEADVFPLKFPERSILIDGAIGEKSVFHESFGYYAHGVAPETSILPEGWQDRLIPVRNENTRGCTGWCLELHDLAASKLAAGREKDMEFLRGMRLEGLIDPATLRTRIKATPFPTPAHAEVAAGRCERLLLSAE
jgi:hypothetical protein